MRRVFMVFAPGLKRALAGLPVRHIDGDNPKADVAQQFKGGAGVAESAGRGVRMTHQNYPVAALSVGHGVKAFAGRHDSRGGQAARVKRRAELFKGHRLHGAVHSLGFTVSTIKSASSAVKVAGLPVALSKAPSSHDRGATVLPFKLSSMTPRHSMRHASAFTSGRAWAARNAAKRSAPAGVKSCIC
nr:MOL98_25 [Synthetic plasmid pMOL98]